MAKVAKQLGKAAAKRATGQSRARAQLPKAKAAPKKCAIPKAERVQCVVELMVKDRWFPKLAWKLSEEWGVGVDAVQAISSEASRIVRGYALPPVEETRTLLVNRLDEAFALARKLRMPNAMVSAVLAHDKITGASGPQKVAFTNTNGEDLPPALALLQDPVIAKFAMLHDRLPTHAEVEALQAKRDPPKK